MALGIQELMRFVGLQGETEGRLTRSMANGERNSARSFKRTRPDNNNTREFAVIINFDAPICGWTLSSEALQHQQLNGVI